MKIIFVKFNTTNPSADVLGYFDNEEKADKEIERMKSVIENNEEYYGKVSDCNIVKEFIFITNNLSQ